MSTACRCRDCRYPTVGDVVVKAVHAARHAAFAALMDERPDWHFRKPTPRQIVVWTAQEMDAPRGCVRPEDVGTIPHPVSHR